MDIFAGAEPEIDAGMHGKPAEEGIAAIAETAGDILARRRIGEGQAFCSVTGVVQAVQRRVEVVHRILEGIDGLRLQERAADRIVFCRFA